MGNNMNISNIKDRFKLMLSAIVLIFVLISIAYFVRRIGISKLWEFYIYGCIIYITSVMYLVCSFVKKSKRNNIMYLVLCLLISILISLGYILFFYGILPMPNNLSVYLVLSMLMAPSTFLILEYYLKIINKSK